MGRLVAWCRFKENPEIPDLETVRWTLEDANEAAAATDQLNPSLIYVGEDIREVTITWREK